MWSYTYTVSNPKPHDNLEEGLPESLTIVRIVETSEPAKPIAELPATFG